MADTQPDSTTQLMDLPKEILANIIHEAIYTVRIDNDGFWWT
jgi:hypothetical protein